MTAILQERETWEELAMRAVHATLPVDGDIQAVLQELATPRINAWLRDQSREFDFQAVLDVTDMGRDIEFGPHDLGHRFVGNDRVNFRTEGLVPMDTPHGRVLVTFNGVKNPQWGDGA